ncbi:uncharacterized protein [Nicotiana tomentosiformis]|uniref:uncharacterized protein n=1 Tax=Nicotiana tomentosiformis TaxID=4098 RepID=UPI00388C3FD4
MRSIVFSIPEDARVFSALVRVSSYLNCFVTKEDQVMMDAVEAPCASVLHHEAFLQIWDELTQHEAKVRELTEKRDTYKLLSKKLQSELEVARKEHTVWTEQVNRVLEDSDDELDSVANDSILKVRQRLEQIGQLQVHVYAIQTEAEEFKKNTDLITTQKEAVQAQLVSVESQLWAAKEKTSVQANRIEELQYELNSTISGQESLGTELETLLLRSDFLSKVNIRR